MLKYMTISAAIMAACGLTVFAQANEPDVSISCFGGKKAICGNGIAIINDSSKHEARNLYVSCPAKSAPKTLYTFGSFSLDPKQKGSTQNIKCYSLEEVRDNCYKSAGFFVAYNIEIIVKSEDYPKWKTSDSCTWK